MRFPKFPSRLVLGLAVAAVGVLTFHHNADARPGYMQEFKELYPNVKDAMVEKCGVCHMGMPQAKKWNEYGTAMGKSLGGKNVKGAAVQQALKKIESEKAPSGKTFGEMLKDGKLPAAKE